ncbi:MAG: hypothetical protein ACTSP6_06055 [Promethearchaeota archaeon]
MPPRRQKNRYGKDKLKITTVNLPVHSHKSLRILVSLGYFASVSEAVRHAVNIMIKDSEPLRRYANFPIVHQDDPAKKTLKTMEGLLEKAEKEGLIEDKNGKHWKIIRGLIDPDKDFIKVNI